MKGKLLKLTGVNGESVGVNADRIITMSRKDAGSSWNGGFMGQDATMIKVDTSFFLVKESVDEIFNMIQAASG